MDSTTQTSTDDDIKLNLFNLAEKLRIELQKKDKELEDKNEENKELSANLDVAMTRANRVDGLETKLDNAQQTIHVLQMSLWKSFPFPGLYYRIKTQSGSQNGRFLRAYDESAIYYLQSSASCQGGRFKFTKNSDGSFSIYSITKGYYLQTHSKSSKVVFACDGGNAEKFVLFNNPQNQQPAISVDICTLAGSFLCVDNNNFVVANSRTPPDDKFLIIPVVQ